MMIDLPPNENDDHSMNLNSWCFFVISSVSFLPLCHLRQVSDDALPQLCEEFGITAAVRTFFCQVIVLPQCPTDSLPF